MKNKYETPYVEIVRFAEYELVSTYLSNDGTGGGEEEEFENMFSDSISL